MEVKIITTSEDQLRSLIRSELEAFLLKADKANNLPDYLTRAQVMSLLGISREIFRKMLDQGWLTDANAKGRKNKIEKQSFVDARERVTRIRKTENRKTIYSKDII